jgi:4-hydroxy-tetrahydrodipicolinate reductase
MGGRREQFNFLLRNLRASYTFNLLKEINSQKIRNMNIALIGYGRMGHEIASVAESRGHVIRLIIDQDNLSDLNEVRLKDTDVAIEFTTPETAFNNVASCLRMKIPVVSGTTGWLKEYKKAAEICIESRTSFIHSSNFSIGVNILFKLNSELAKQMSRHAGYKPLIEEIHHTKKLDAPSGTAISLANSIRQQNPDYDGWCFENDKVKNKIPVRSVREGNVTGIHNVIWESEIDIISLRHEAKNRKGLALGAVVAAEYINTRKGVFTMDDVLGL